jgi:uncharacterized protein (DUF433 family)
VADRSTSTTRQRSFRLPEATLRELGLLASERGESANGLARRLIQEGLRTERHPLVYFREGAAGRRPAILGTRLDVWHIVEYLVANDRDVAQVAELLDIPEHWVQAAAGYYAEHTAEVDAWATAQFEFARRAEDAYGQRATSV